MRWRSRPFHCTALTVCLLHVAPAIEAQQASPVVDFPVERRGAWPTRNGRPDGVASWAWIPATAPAREEPIATDSARHIERSSWSVLASAVVPGAGQAMLHQKRAVAYLAVEAMAWSTFASHRRVARSARDRYRSLAATVARAPFSDRRPVGDFDYYERMEHFLASGRFDLASGAGMLHPEEDSATYNGAMWLLARRTYWTDPSQPPPRTSIEWTRAEAFYLQRAIRPEFQWSWGGATDEYAQFRQLIRRSNDTYRSALSDLGLALGNHVLSTIDASISLRLEQRRLATSREYRVSVEIPLDLGR